MFSRFVADLEDERLEGLDALLIVPEGDDETPLNWLRRPPGPPSPKNFKDVLDRLTFVRSLSLPDDTDKNVHHNRLIRPRQRGCEDHAATSQTLRSPSVAEQPSLPTSLRDQRNFPTSLWRCTTA